MELSGESLIQADRQRVWNALNDPAILARCIDGVDTLSRETTTTGVDRFGGRMNARVGPVRATFTGSVTLTQVDAPNRYVLVGEGKGGVAGFAKGEAEVVLAEENNGASTRLTYAVTSSVGGKLAQLGARLIEGTARGYAETFFARFKAEVETPVEPVTVAPTVADTRTAPAAVAAITDEAQALHGTRPRTGLSPLIWGGVLILGVIAVLVWELT